MDLNIRIIEAVKECPALYKFSKFHSASRKQMWKLIAEKLNLQEQFLKIRWHSLLQRYQNDLNFKYSKHMSFLNNCDVSPKQIQDVIKSKVDVVVKTENYPEFVITENDLLPATGGNYEYVFVEVEDLANATDLENRKIILEDHLGMHQKANDNQITIEPSCKPDHLNNQQMVIRDHLTNSLIEEDKNVVQKADKRSDFDLEDKSLEQLKSMELTNDKYVLCNKNSNSITVSLANSGWNHSLADRSEDVIFGELIIAMLKKMDDNKRRTVKKEIINLLLT